MRTKFVTVLPYNEKWKEDFENIKIELIKAIGDIAISIEHVGSTSVEGLAAKPIIDIDVVVKKENLPNAIKMLEGIGYKHEGNLGIEEREAFTYEGKEHLQEHHLYVCPEDSKELKRHLAFRDYLRSHKYAVEQYGKIKTEAARLYPDDIDKYMEYKSPVIDRIYEQMNYKFRLATLRDLPILKQMYMDIIADMYNHAIYIWDDIYPCVMFEDDIKNKRIYILQDGETIVSAFSISFESAGAKSVKWKYSLQNSIYMDRLGVNVNYARKGIGSRMLSECENIAQNMNAETLRFFVVDYNEPAIRLYEKCGFSKAEGTYEEVIDKDLVLHEYGYEKIINER